MYGLFHHLAHTPQGRTRLRQYFLRPSLNIDVINQRLDFISIFFRPDNAPFLEKLTKSLKKIKNIRTIMIHLHKGISAGNAKLGGFKSGVWATLLAVSTLRFEKWVRKLMAVVVCLSYSRYPRYAERDCRSGLIGHSSEGSGRFLSILITHERI